MKNTYVTTVYSNFLDLKKDINDAIRIIESGGGEVITFQVATIDNTGDMQCLIMYR